MRNLSDERHEAYNQIMPPNDEDGMMGKSRCWVDLKCTTISISWRRSGLAGSKPKGQFIFPARRG